MLKAFIENGRLLALIIILLIVSGLGALSTIPRTEDPRITNRIASVFTVLPGASAERVEALVSEKIESKLRKQSEIKLITSVSRAGVSLVKIELKDDITNTKPIWSRSRDLLNDVAPELPQNASVPRLDDDKGYAFTMLLSLNWTGVGEVDLAILGRYGKALQNQLRTVSGTDYVELYGEPDEEILLQIDPDRVASMQLSATDIATRVEAADAKVSAGQLVNQHNQMQVELTGALDSVNRIRQIPLRHDDQGFVTRIGDIATVSRQVKWPAKEMAVVNNQDAIVIGTRMLPKLRIDKWTGTVEQQLEQFKQMLPSNVEVEVIFSQNSYTDKRLGELVENILMGFVLIALVLLVSLGWRSALVVTFSLPLTVLFTLSVMKYYGLPIHQMSVTGLVVALGIMVDNAIVMADTIQQRMQQGLKATEAVIASLKHLWLPLLGSTLTTILAFMPIVLMPGPAGEFVGGIALSVIFSLIGSYFISHIVVSTLAGRFIKAEQHQSPRWYHNGIQFAAGLAWFKGTLNWVLNYPRTTIALVFILPLCGFLLASKLDEQFFPSSDRDMFHIELNLPTQSSILHTKKITGQITQLLKKEQGITAVRWFIGNDSPSFYYNMVPRKEGAQNYAQAMITAEDFIAANRLIPLLQRKLDDAMPGAQILVRKLEQGPPFNAPVEIRVFGPNLDTLKTIGQDLRRIFAQTKDVIHSRTTLQPGTPKVWLQVNEEAGQLGGLTLTDMAGQLQTSLQGLTRGSILEATESIPVRVRIGNEARKDVQGLYNLNLTSAGEQVYIPVSAISALKISPSRGAIPRRDGSRVNVIEGYIRAGVLPSTVLNRISAQLDAEGFQLPAGYRMEFGGESAKRNSAIGNLMASVGLIVTLLITVVVLSFNSFRLSALIFLSAFQSVGLGLLSVYLFDYPFGFTVIIGLLGLMGLAINAAIVIVAELKIDPKAVAGDNGAIIDAVLACTRHITSTTITTVGGFLPLILAGGGFWPPFAVAIAGGTVLTTLLSFYFVPAAFKLMSTRKAFEVASGAGANGEVVVA
ncbi:MAG: multidrug efflux pump [Alteromonadaceae bacterium]|jgi:multidrug efflux pump